jgi:hypothetical protein
MAMEEFQEDIEKVDLVVGKVMQGVKTIIELAESAK